MDQRLIDLGRGNPQHAGAEGSASFASLGRDRAPADTSQRTTRLDALKAKKAEETNALRNDRDLTPEARNRQIGELSREYDARIREEAAAVLERLDEEIEKAFRASHPLDKPTGDDEADILRELRHRRISEEVMEELAGGTDPIAAFDRAVRLGDDERAEIVAKHAGRFLDWGQRRELDHRLEERLPERVKRARTRLQRLEAERRSLEVGLSLQGLGR